MVARKKTAKKVAKVRKAKAKKVRKTRVRRPRGKLTALVIPEGWRRLGLSDEIQLGDAYWDVKHQAWITLTQIAAPMAQQNTSQYTVIRRVPLPPPPLLSGETSAAREHAMRLQTKIRGAVEDRCDTELESRQGQITTGGFGQRLFADGTTILATPLSPGELAEYIAKNPIFDKRHLGWVPPGTDALTESLFKHYLSKISEEDRAKLYAQGGMDAVRNLAMRLARHALRRRVTPRPRRKARR